MSEKGAVQAKKAECLSMTGYAQSKGSALGWDLRVSVKSVNHRFLDLKVRLPEGFDLYELRLRQMVRERIHRGHIEVHVSLDPGAATAISVNKDLVTNYLRAADELRFQTSVSAALDVVALLRLPGVIGGMAPAVPESEEEQEPTGCSPARWAASSSWAARPAWPVCCSRRPRAGSRPARRWSAPSPGTASRIRSGRSQPLRRRPRSRTTC